MTKLHWALLAALTCLAGCSSTNGTAASTLQTTGDEPAAQTGPSDPLPELGAPTAYDPFEGFNRRMFAFNEGLDRYVLEPSVKVYRIAPQPARNRVRDFIDNLKTPVWFANEVLQGDWDGAGAQLGRFTLNTTLGLAGFYDFAGNVAGIKKVDEDFGQTLGVWGAPNGPYLVLPILGPSTARDSVGRIVDIALDPLSYANGEDIGEFRTVLFLTDNLDLRDRLDGLIQLARQSADPYVQAREIYIQTRTERTFFEDGRSYDDLPPLDEDDSAFTGDGARP